MVVVTQNPGKLSGASLNDHQMVGIATNIPFISKTFNETMLSHPSLAKREGVVRE
jgi:hypothetical protein